MSGKGKLSKTIEIFDMPFSDLYLNRFQSQTTASVRCDTDIE